MAFQNPEIHFLIVPLMSQSHLIPMIDFAKILTKHGFRVSIITTPLNSARFEPMIERVVKLGHKIQLIPLRFPCQEAGLPEGCENYDTVTSPDLSKIFFEASSMLQGPVEKLVSEMKPRINCMISSNGVPWGAEIAQKFDLPWYVFDAISCFTMLLSHNLSLDEDAYIDSCADTDTVLVPNMPHKIEFNKAQLEPIIKTTGKFKDVIEKMKKADQSVKGRLINTFEEMEGSYIEAYKEIKKKIWCIGPVSLSDNEISDKFNRGNKACVDQHFCLNWLDSRKPESVVYVCFGSLCHVPFLQLIEIGLGLEASGCNFIWVIRGCDNSEDFDKWLKDEEFEERNKLRGLVIRGWAPQVLILSHPSTGGFMTHCGWNSTLECISVGVPMITWPMFAEQFYNEKLVTTVLNTGVRIGVEAGMEWGEEKLELMVKRESVKKAIELLMSEDEEGIERRKRARKLGEVAKTAVEEGGSSYSNITSFINDVIETLHRTNLPCKDDRIKIDCQENLLEK